MGRVCIVPGCPGTKEGIFRFPWNAKRGLGFQNQMRRYSEWIDIVGCEELRTLDSSKARKAYRICGRHFTKDMISQFNGRNYLLPTAVPCLNLPTPHQKSKTQTQGINQPFQREPICSIDSINALKEDENTVKMCSIDLKMHEYNLQPLPVEFKRSRRFNNDYTSTEEFDLQDDVDDDFDEIIKVKPSAIDYLKPRIVNNHISTEHSESQDTNDKNTGDADDDSEICVVLVTFDFINQLNQYKNNIDVDKEEMEKYDQIVKNKSIKLVKQIHVNNGKN